MKVKTIILYTDTNHIGGAELQMFLIAKFLNKSEFKPVLVCSKNKSLDTWCKKFSKENIKIIRLNVLHKHDPRHYFQLKDIIKKEKADVLHIHIWNTASGRYAFYAGTHMKTPIITTEHDVFQLSGIKKYIKIKSLKRIKRIITPSKHTQFSFNNLYPEFQNLTKIIYPTIDTCYWESQLTPITKKEIIEIKEKVFLAKQNTFIITCIANLTKNKQIDQIIKATKIITEKYKNIKIVIVGDGHEKNNLIHLTKKLKLEKNVIFLGKRENIVKILKSSNLFINASNRESFGLTNLEAMISNIPVLATKTGIIQEIIKNNKNGIILQNNTPKNIAIQVLDLIKNKEQLNQIASNGRKTIEQVFSTKIMTQQYQKEYSNLIETR